jgi:RNA polymerase sigma factor (sigma-70 family)
VPLTGLFIGQRSLVTDGSCLAAVPLLRGDEPDGAVAVLMHVQVNECHRPLARLLLAGKGPAGVVGPLFSGAEQRLRVWVVVLIQVAREALVCSAPRCRAGEPPAPYLRRCITGALQHHLRDRVRLVRIPHRLHVQGQCPLGHLSLDASSDGGPSILDQLAAPEAEPAISEAMDGLALEQLVEQLPAAQATALRLTVLEGLSLRQAALRLEISCMSVQRAQKKALAALRQHLAGGG